MKKLTHNEARKMVQPFLDGKLSDPDKRAFLAHIRQCKSCYDELETYFIVDRALRYLDDNVDETYDIQQLLKDQLDREEHELRLHRILRIVAVLALIAIILVVALTLIESLRPDLLRGFPIVRAIRHHGRFFRRRR